MTEYICELEDARYEMSWAPKEEIVRCRACKHYEPRAKDGVCHRSKFISLYAMDNGFCAWAVRRDA